ncbi:uncharacterized protein RB166_013631 [Leptodactylus fuscus]|uniref:uncharacterized protein LOC142214325 n=1 Tax=Leptodactylus fuscus TaxID=238119 RepID=UPI003F4EBF98
MDSKVSVFELQNDCSVKRHEVPLTFPRDSRRNLCIVTNQRTQLHLLKNSEGSPRPEEDVAFQEKRIFQHGVSTKVFAITDVTDNAWEVRLLLSPSEIARLSSNFNLTGFVIGCLTIEEYQDCLSSLCGPEAEVKKLCMAAAQFLSFSEDKVKDYCKDLEKILIEKVGASRTGQQRMEDMVTVALVALAAAEVATSVGGSKNFDYKIQKEKTEEDQSEQIQEMVRIFDVEANLLTVSHQGKRVQIIFRNPCPDNWASGGKKLVESGETFGFGLCHKVVSISEAKSEIQFLQNLQESYDLVPIFHLPAFVEHLLMTSSWRNKIELFLKDKDQRKDMVQELSTLAVRFICGKACHQETFLKEFQGAMLEKWSSLEALLVGDEVVCSFGILMAILAALTAKNIADRPNIDIEDEEMTITTRIEENGEEQPDLGSSLDDWVKLEHELDDGGNGGAESKTGSTDEPGPTDQEGIDDSLKAEDPLTETVTDVGIADNPEEETDSDDENFSKHPNFQDNVHESSPTSPDTKGGLHGQGKGGGPSLDDSYDDGARRVAQPKTVGAEEKSLEIKVSSSKNRVFYTSFIGLVFLLVLAMLTNILPQSLGSVLLALILGLLVITWLASRQP